MAPLAAGDRLRNQKGGDGADRAVGQNDRLDEAGGFGGGLGEQSTSAGVGAEVEVKGAVLLEENEDVLDVLAKQSEFLSVSEIRRVFYTQACSGQLRARSRCDFHKFLLSAPLHSLRQRGDWQSH